MTLTHRAARRRKAVFLDRDGVINVFPGRGKFVLNWDGFRFRPGVKSAISRLREAGFFVALVTNQSGVGRGLMTLDDLREIHARMQEALGESRLDAIYYCPHHPDEGCACRKPSPRLILRAAEEHGLDLARSFMVGDSERDIEMGRAAGCRACLCRARPPLSAEALAPRCRPEHLCRTLAEAVDWILAADCKLERKD